MRRGVVVALSFLVVGLAGVATSAALQRPPGLVLFSAMAFLGSFLMVAELMCSKRGLMCSWRL